MKTNLMTMVLATVAVATLAFCAPANADAAGKTVTKTAYTGSTVTVKNVKKIVDNKGDKKIAVNIRNNRYHMCRSGKMTFVLKNGKKVVYRVKTRSVKNAKITAATGDVITIPVTSTWSEKIRAHKWHVKSSDISVVPAELAVTYGNINNSPTVQVKAVKTGSANVTVTSPCGVKFVETITVTPAESAVSTDDKSGETVVLPENNEAKAEVSDDAATANTDAEAAAQAAREAAEAAENAAKANDADAAQAAADSADKAAEAAENAAQAANSEAAAKAAEEARAAADRAAAEAAEAQARAEAEAQAKAEAEAAAKAEALAQAIDKATAYRELETGETTTIEIPEGYFYTNTEGRFGVVSVSVSDGIATVTAQAKGVVYVTFANAEGNVIQAPIGVTK